MGTGIAATPVAAHAKAAQNCIMLHPDTDIELKKPRSTSERQVRSGSGKLTFGWDRCKPATAI